MDERQALSRTAAPLRVDHLEDRALRLVICGKCGWHLDSVGSYEAFALGTATGTQRWGSLLPTPLFLSSQRRHQRVEMARPHGRCRRLVPLCRRRYVCFGSEDSHLWAVDT